MRRKITPEEFINKFLVLLNQVNKTDINKYLNSIERSDYSQYEFFPLNPKNKRSTNKELKAMIGTLPFVLLSKQYFPTNTDLYRFANSMGIRIQFWKKRSRPEMIGIIITEVSQFKPPQLYRFNNILNEVLGIVEKYEKSDFFDEWSKTIKTIKFRR